MIRQIIAPMNWSMSLPLNKEVCKVCRRDTASFHPYPWKERDDDFWDMQGQVNCPYGVHNLGQNQHLTMRIGSDPIPSCPYYLEQLVSDVEINHGPFHKAFGMKLINDLDAEVLKDLSC
jgi:hypothetical protein